MTTAIIWKFNFNPFNDCIPIEFSYLFITFINTLCHSRMSSLEYVVLSKRYLKHFKTTIKMPHYLKKIFCECNIILVAAPYLWTKSKIYT